MATRVVGAQVAVELAAAGHDVEGVAGVQDGRHRREPVRPVRVVVAGDRLGGGGEREQRVAPAVGRRAGVRGAPVGGHADRARPPCGAPRRPRRRRRCARRPRSTGTRPSRRSARRGRRPPCATPRRRPAAARPPRRPPGRSASARSAPSASTTPPFMSTVPEPTSRSPSRVSGAWSVVRDHGVEVAEQQDAPGAGPAAGGRAGPARGRARSTARARRRPRPAAAPRTPRRIRRRRARRPTARRRRPAPRARARRARRSRRPPAAPTDPWGRKLLSLRARAARDGDHRPPPGSGAGGRRRSSRRWRPASTR